jgi:hypothetical protein
MRSDNALGQDCAAAEPISISRVVSSCELTIAAFVYNSPTYDLTGLASADRTTNRAEPSLGFGYRI